MSKKKSVVDDVIAYEAGLYHGYMNFPDGTQKKNQSEFDKLIDAARKSKPKSSAKGTSTRRASSHTIGGDDLIFVGSDEERTS